MEREREVSHIHDVLPGKHPWGLSLSIIGDIGPHGRLPKIIRHCMHLEKWHMDAYPGVGACMGHYGMHTCTLNTVIIIIILDSNLHVLKVFLALPAIPVILYVCKIE